MKQNVVKILWLNILMVMLLCFLTGCLTETQVNEQNASYSTQEVVSISVGMRGDGVDIEMYLVTAIDTNNQVYLYSIKPDNIHIVNSGKPLLKCNENSTYPDLYITREDFINFLNN